MKLVIGSSMKYRDLARKVLLECQEIGVNAVFPNLDYSHEKADKAQTIEEKQKLALEHYREIDTADAVYLLTPQGYMGTSCTLELGYAIAKGKDIYFSEPTNDSALDCYVKEFIPTHELHRFKTLDLTY